MRKILIVSPGFTYGGSTTALLSLLHSNLTKSFQIDIFSIAKGDNDSSTLRKHDIGLNNWTKAFYSDFKSLSIKEKLFALFIKLLKRLPGYDDKVEKLIVRLTTKKIIRKNYDCVIAFQEKRATSFCQFIPVDEKIAWIHCDYARTYPRTESDVTLYSKYSQIVCVSNATRDSFLKYYPMFESRTSVVYNLFDSSSIIEMANSAIDDTRFRVDITSIISVGRLNRIKRFNLIPDIAKEVYKTNPNFRWYIIGQPYSDEELKKLENAINKSGVNDIVIYLGGKTNPYPFFKAASLLVCVSESEACPMIFNEAKLLNLKIVSTDFPSAYEFIDEGKNGFISSLDEIPEMIIKCIMTHPFEKTHSEDFDVDKLNSDILMKLSQLFDEKN